jgi:hypothetical protein
MLNRLLVIVPPAQPPSNAAGLPPSNHFAASACPRHTVWTFLQRKTLPPPVSLTCQRPFSFTSPLALAPHPNIPKMQRREISHLYSPTQKPAIISQQDHPNPNVGQASRLSQNQGVGQASRLSQNQGVGQASRLSQNQGVGQASRLSQNQGVGQASRLSQNHKRRKKSSLPNNRRRQNRHIAQSHRLLRQLQRQSRH